VADEDNPINGNIVTDETGDGVDSDPESDPLTVIAVNGSGGNVGSQIALGNGLLTVNADGTYSFDPNGGYESLGVGESTSESFTYTISDGNGGTDTATVTIVINGVNDAPDAIDNDYSTDEDTPVGGNIVTDETGDGVDSDPDGDTLTVIAVDGDGGNVDTQIALGNGLLTVNANGTYSFDPNGGYESLGVGESTSESFTYTISDGNGGTDTATVTIVINGVNDAPDAIDNDYSTDEDTPVGGNIVTDETGDGVDSDPDGDTLTVIAVDGDGGNVDTQIALGNGLLTVNANGTYSFDPNGGYESLGVGESTSESFTYTISDGNGGTDTATVTIVINGVNDAPDAIDNDYSTDSESSVNGNIVSDETGDGVDSDPDGDTLTVISVDGDGGNVDTQIALGNGLLTVNADGSYTFDPNGGYESLGAGESTSESFTYTISDGNGGTDTATVTIVINGVNDAPDAIDNDYTTDEDTPVNGNIVTDETGDGVDSDPDGDTLTVIAVDGDGGNVDTQIALGNGLLTVNANGTYSFDPNGGYESLGVGESTSESFTYTISDGNGGTDTATVTIVINGVNDGPSISATATAVVSEEGLPGGIPDTVGTDDTTDSITANGSFTVSDPDGDALTVVFNSAPADGFLTVDGADINWSGVGTQTLTGTGGGTTITLTIDNTGAYTVAIDGPVDHANGAIEDDLDFNVGVLVSDGNGGSATGTLTVTIEDDSPIAGVDFLLVSNSLGTSNGDMMPEFGADGGTVTGVSADNLPDGFSISSQSTDGGGVITTVISNADNTASFELVMNPDGTYTFEVLDALDPNSIEQTLTGLTAGGPVPSLVLNVGGPETGIVATFTSPSGGGINSSTNGMGVANNTVSGTESIQIAFNQSISAITLDVQKLSTGEQFEFELHLDDPVNTVLTGTFTAPGGFGEGDTIPDVDLIAAGGFSAGQLALIEQYGFSTVIIEANNTGDFRLLSMEITETELPTDVVFNFEVQLTDADGDTAISHLTIDVDGNGDGVADINGTSGNDHLVGGSLADLLIGFEGGDTFYGQGGDDEITLGVDASTNDNASDTVVIGVGDGVDTIYGFDVSDPAGTGDFLDVSELFTDPAGFVSFDGSADVNGDAINDYVVSVSADGGPAVQVAILDGASLFNETGNAAADLADNVSANSLV
jgi:hypothetical protein